MTVFGVVNLRILNLRIIFKNVNLIIFERKDKKRNI